MKSGKDSPFDKRVPGADAWIDRLGLQPHPEGGFFREIYRSDEIVGPQALPDRYRSARCLSTSIYFLLKSGQVSRLHRLGSDELWHFYAGSSMHIHVLRPKGDNILLRVGLDVEKGELPFAAVPKNSWFGAEVAVEGSYSLVGCTVAPGFDFEDFELGNKSNLLRTFPESSSLIERLT